ncbi:hypothetical protein B0H11DRAFT_2271083, partial [Mycena galericulata]
STKRLTWLIAARRVPAQSTYPRAVSVIAAFHGFVLGPTCCSATSSSFDLQAAVPPQSHGRIRYLTAKRVVSARPGTAWTRRYGTRSRERSRPNHLTCSGSREKIESDHWISTPALHTIQKPFRVARTRTTSKVHAPARTQQPPHITRSATTPPRTSPPGLRRAKVAACRSDGDDPENAAISLCYSIWNIFTTFSLSLIPHELARNF